jgi:hypothetical protein
MTVCDVCRKPRDVSFAVCPYLLSFCHENIEDHQPKMLASYELCERCAQIVIARLYKVVQEVKP